MKSIIQAVYENAIEHLDNEINRWPTVKELMLGVRGKPTHPEDIRLTIKHARRRLENDYCVCSVSETFYTGLAPINGDDNENTGTAPFTEILPKTAEEASYCVPGGTGGKLAGLYFPDPEIATHDLIYLEFVSRYATQGTAQTALNMRRMSDGVTDEVLNSRKSVKVIEESMAQAALERMTPALEKVLNRFEDVMERVKELEKK